jgi:hypothetical protein
MANPRADTERIYHERCLGILATRISAAICAEVCPTIDDLRQVRRPSRANAVAWQP